MRCCPFMLGLEAKQPLLVVHVGALQHKVGHGAYNLRVAAIKRG